MKSVFRLPLWALLTAAVAGCAGLPAVSPAPTTFALESAVTADSPPASASAVDAALLVGQTRSGPGLDSHRMLYVRQAHQLEFFANNRWIDSPARMLPPLIVGVLARKGHFRAVIPAPTPAAAEYRLDTEIVRLQQEFLTQPSQVRFTLRAYLSEQSSGHVLARREFEAVVPASEDNPRAGVAAANAAVNRVLEKLADFCAEAVGRRGAVRPARE